MSYADSFNAMSANAEMDGDDVIFLHRGGWSYRLDFTLREQMTWYTGSGSVLLAFGSLSFSELDPNFLELCRNKLIDMGGKPPELPLESPSNRSPAKRFNL